MKEIQGVLKLLFVRVITVYFCGLCVTGSPIIRTDSNLWYVKQNVCSDLNIVFRVDGLASCAVRENKDVDHADERANKY